MANLQFDSVSRRYSNLCDNALRLNNIGVKYLVQGNEKLAIESLSNAMHILKYLIGVSATAKKGIKARGWCARKQCSNENDTHTNTGMEHETVPLSHHYHDHHHWAQQQQYLNQDDGPALFDHAITIVPRETPLINVEDREDYLITSTAVAIFNIALAYHCMGLCTTSGNQAQHQQVYPSASTASSSQHSHSSSSYYYYMAKAANIYEMAVKMLLGRSSRTAMLVQLASIHNILEIQLSMTTTGDRGVDLSGEAKKAPNGQELFSILLTCQQQLPLQQQLESLLLLSELPALQDPQLRDLVSTILLLLKPTTIAAAA